MNEDSRQFLPLPDKRIPLSVMLIGAFGLAGSLLGLIVLMVIGRLDGLGLALLVSVGV